MDKPNFIRTAQDKIKSAVNALKRKHNGKDVITPEALTGIYFELHPGVDELHADYAELHAVADGLNVAVMPMSELNAVPVDAYRVI